MNIAAFDLSLTQTGWARSCGGGREVGTIPTRGLRGMPRLDHVRQRVLDLATGSDLVVIEGYSFGSQGTAVVNLGELGGVVRLSLHLAGMPWVEVPPSTLKKYLAGRGNAPKEAVLAAAIRRLGYEGANHNDADALGLLAAALEWYGEPIAELPRDQVAALAKVPWPRLADLRRGEAPRVCAVGGR